MATRKSQKAPSSSTKRAPAKRKTTASAKAKTIKPKASAKIDESRKIKGYAGMDDHFYKKFPRYAAYQILLKAKGRTMIVKAFLDKIEKLDGVSSRKQAQGIVQKLVDKKRHVGGNCATFV